MIEHPWFRWAEDNKTWLAYGLVAVMVVGIVIAVIILIDTDKRDNDVQISSTTTVPVEQVEGDEQFLGEFIEDQTEAESDAFIRSVADYCGSEDPSISNQDYGSCVVRVVCQPDGWLTFGITDQECRVIAWSWVAESVPVEIPAKYRQVGAV